MAPVKDGGPAFPNVGNGDWTNRDNDEKFSFELTGGMKLRDYFAAQAIIGAGAWPTRTQDGLPIGLPEVASWAYRLADAMLAERERGR